MLRTLLASLLILAVGVAALGAATNGFRAFTTETALRASVREQPRALPAVSLQTAKGNVIHLAKLRGRWLLVNFIYTHCASYCSIQGTEFARLQARFAAPIAAGRLRLLSISFDPARDGPKALSHYKQRSGGHGVGWIVARPTNPDALEALKRTFGVTVIADGLGGYVHNSAINVIGPRGRLVAVLDWDAPKRAARRVRLGLAP